MRVRSVTWDTVVLVAVSAGAVWFARSFPVVHAAETSSAAPVMFQMQGTGPDAQLSIYDSSTRTISVYQGVGSGSDTKSCSYQYVVGRIGGSIHRKTCDVGTLP